MRFVNLTEHVINVEGLEPIQPSGIVARVAETIREIGGTQGVLDLNVGYSEVVGLPGPSAEEGAVYIVSGLVLSALADSRQDVRAPYTGGDKIFGANRQDGKIVSVKAFVAPRAKVTA